MLLIEIFRGVPVLVSMRRSVNMVDDRYARRLCPSESVLRRECRDRRRSYQRRPRAENCEDRKERTLTALGLVCRDRSYDLRGDGVAEDMILLIPCCNTSAPELPAVWCLKNGKDVFLPPPKIKGPDQDLAVVVRPTSKTTTSFEPRTILRVVVPERVRCTMGGSGRLHLRYPSKDSPRS